MEAVCLSCLATVVCDPLKQALGDFLQRTAESLLSYFSGRALALWDAFSRLRNPVEAVPVLPASAITGEEGEPSEIRRPDPSEAERGVKADNSFALDGSSGKKGYMISARGLTIVHGRDKLYWRWTTRPDSRFPEVAELLKIWWFEITGEVDVRELSPGTHYASHLVFDLCEQTEGLSDYQEASITVGGQEHSKCRVCLAPEAPGSSELPLGSPENLVKLPRRRDDGWMEMELGEFFVDQGSPQGVVRIKVKDVDDALKKSGLIVASMEVRPKGSR